MAFKYRRSVDEALAVGKDFPLNSTYAATAKAGDVVMLSSGEVVLATSGATAILGVIQGFTFEGVGVTPKVAKVQIDADAIYEADKVGAGLLTLGTAYGIDGSSNLDTGDTTTTVAKIVDVVNGKPYVMITARQLF